MPSVLGTSYKRGSSFVSDSNISTASTRSSGQATSHAATSNAAPFISNGAPNNYLHPHHNNTNTNANSAFAVGQVSSSQSNFMSIAPGGGGGGGTTICTGNRFMRAISVVSLGECGECGNHGAHGCGGGGGGYSAYHVVGDYGSSSHLKGLGSVGGGGARVGEYTLIKQLGDGTYGTVFLATHNRTHESFAVKRILVDRRCMSSIEKQVRREATLMQGLHHPHVVRLIQVLQTPDAFYFVMELAEGGELFDMVINSKRFSECTARKYFQQLISALYYCHSRDVIHRDLKAENLLLSRTGQLKVCDFGFSLHFKTSELEEGGEGGEVLGEPECGTVDYMAPEYARTGGFGGCGAPGDDVGCVLDPHMHDLWAAAVILYFMLVGSLPFHGRSEEETLYKISHTPANLDVIEPEGARRLLARMLAMDPTDRPSLAEIIADPWFAVGLDHGMFPEHKSTSLLQRHTTSLSGTGTMCLKKSSRLFLDFSPAPSGENLDMMLTEGENEALTDAFGVMDVDDDGYLTRDELRDAILELNPNIIVPREAVAAIINCFIPEGHDGIDLEGFKYVWVHRDADHGVLRDLPYFRLRNLSTLVHAPVDPTIVRAVRNVFDRIDTDHDGFFTVKDVEALLTRGVPAPASDVTSLSGRVSAASCATSPTTAIPPPPLTAAVAPSPSPSCMVSTNPSSLAPTSLLTVDSIGVRELISYMDTKGSGTILFDEFLTATARSNVLLDHRVGSQLRRIIPEMTELRSKLLLTGARFTVSGTMDSVLQHLAIYSPDKLRFDTKKNETGAGVELLFDYLRSEDDIASSCTGSMAEPGTPHLAGSYRTGGSGAVPVGGSSGGSSSPLPVTEAVGGSSGVSMPATPPNAHYPSGGGLGGGNPLGGRTHSTIASGASTGQLGTSPPQGDFGPQVPLGVGAGKSSSPSVGLDGSARFGASHHNLSTTPSFHRGHRHSCSHSHHQQGSGGYSYGAFGSPPRLADGVSCRLSVQLTRLCEGFVGVYVTRIAGATMYYHEAMALVMASIEAEREQAVHETQPVGDSELM